MDVHDYPSPIDDSAEDAGEVQNGGEDERDNCCCCRFFLELVIYLLLLLIFVPLLLLCYVCCLCCCVRVEFLMAEDTDPGHLRFETPEEMKAYIESKLITRKVVAADCKRSNRLSEYMDELSNRERAYSSFVAAVRPSSDLSVEFSPPLPRSASCPELAATDSLSPKGSDGKSSEDAAEEGRYHSTHSNDAKPRRMCNVVARSISSSLRSHSVDHDCPKTCNICLLNFKVGEDVCWSPNSECTHAYHKECIVSWLMNKPTCPECRRNYLGEGSSDENTAEEPLAVENVETDPAT